ncbi:PAAR domain-containing protein [Photorhabdus khanii]|uniref:PAAR domain-containing protein n=1 Tax=Photorhabdus khanii subsp. guanajuatensis TaxID=2100166 RepID=A0A4R4JLC5_9GAMM|nr:PAAR domain-containing protein [Photorhabdus khanii]TDB54241.1 PAAR domain-containing protein [Photorhabdus khanii subsp. guanajuatensis]
MLKNIIRQGDKTFHGGSVLAGDDSFQMLGKGVARINDPVSCPTCGGDQTIAEGTSAAIGPHLVEFSTADVRAACLYLMLKEGS